MTSFHISKGFNQKGSLKALVKWWQHAEFGGEEAQQHARLKHWSANFV
jgi:hypothetical protein